MDNVVDMSFNGKNTNGYFGFSVSAAGDVDGDAHDDVLFGEPGNDMVYVLSDGITYAHAVGETAMKGTVTNTYTSTQTQDDTYESIAEVSSGGTILSNFLSGGGTDKWARAYNLMTANVAPGDGPVPTGSTADFSTATAIQASDAIYYTTAISTAGRWGYHQFEFNVNEVAAELTSITIYWEGRNVGQATYTCYFYIWNFASSSWQLATSGAGSDNMFTVTYSSNLNNYLSAGKIYTIATTQQAGNFACNFATDYVYVQTVSPATYALEHKWSFTLTPGESQTFEVDGHYASEGAKFYYSTTGTTPVGTTGWTEMTGVNFVATSDTDTYLSFTDSMLPILSGTVYIGVRDVDRTGSDTTANTLYIDHMSFSKINKLKQIIGEEIYASQYYNALSDVAAAGTVSPSTNGYLSTQTSDDTYESITEANSAATYDSDYADTETFTQSASHTNDCTATLAQDGTSENIVELSVAGATSWTNQIRYLRSDQVTVNELTAYNLGTAQSTTGILATSLGNQVAVYAGIRVYVRNSAGTTNELTSAVVGIAYRAAGGGSGMVTGATWTPPLTTLTTTDSIVIELYQGTNSPPSTLVGTFTTAQLGATSLTNIVWTPYYYLSSPSTGNPRPSSVGWGSSTYNTRIANFNWSATSSPHYSLEHKWQFTTVPSSANQYEFQAHVGWTAGGDDNYQYYYSTTGTDPVGGGAWTSMFTDNTQALDTWTFDLDFVGYAGGAFYVGVIDTVGSGDTQSTLNVDYMRVYTTVTPASVRLEHKWTVSVGTIGTDTIFNLEAYRTTNLDAEHIAFFYSTTGSGAVSTWTKMFDVTKTSDDNSYQTYSDATLDAFTGTLYIGVIDASLFDSNLDTIYVDDMYIQVAGGKVNTYFGWSVSGAGDVNNDNTNDVIIGAPGLDKGKAHLYYGSENIGLLTNSVTNDTQAQFNTGTLKSTFATSAGDVNLTNPQNFDAQNNTDNPGGWIVTEAGGSIAVSNEQSVSASNSVKFVDTTARVNISKAISLPTTFTIEFDARVTTTTGWFQILGPSSTYTAGIQMLFYTDGTIIYYDGAIHVLQTYSANQWYHFRLDVDCTLAPFNYDIYIDGVSRATDAAFLNDVQVGKITFATGTASSTAYLDNVKLENYIWDAYGHMTSATYATSGNIFSVKPVWGATLNSEALSVRVSRDGGTTYSPSLTSGVEYQFTNGEPSGNQLRYRVEMSGTGSATPVLHDITIHCYCPGAANVTFVGQSSGDRFGWSVHGAGDINSDGYDDIIVGAPYNANGGSGAGAVYVFNGSASMAGTISASNADYIKNGSPGSHYGWSVGKAGDLDDDGKNDVIAGAPDRDNGTTADAGWTQVLSILSVIVPVPEFSATLIAIFIPLGISFIVFRRRRKRNGERRETPV
jgi:hypothetical protein